MKAQRPPAPILRHGLEQLGLPDLTEPLLAYLFLLEKWNHVYNLTAIRDVPAMVTRHALDSLAILPYLQGTSVIDVGTGPGLPGIPLAIARPTLRLVLLDSNGKKTRFLDEVKRQLKLDNIEIVHSRAENYHPPLAFDTVISRAFSDIAQMVSWTKHLVAKDGIWLAMKGRHPETELAMIEFPNQVHPYHVPGLDGERCAVIINNQ